MIILKIYQIILGVMNKMYKILKKITGFKKNMGYLKILVIMNKLYKTLKQISQNGKQITT